MRCCVSSEAFRQANVAEGAYMELMAKPLVLQLSLRPFRSIAVESMRTIS